MKFLNALKVIPRIPMVWRYTSLLSQANNDLYYGRLKDASEKLELAEDMWPNRVEAALLSAVCYLGLEDFASGGAVLKNIDEKINGSRNSDVDKKYLQLYAKHLRLQLLYKGKEAGAISSIFDKARDLRPDVQKRYLRKYPMKFAWEDK